MSGSLESVRWNTCEHRLDLGLFSHPKEFWGNRSGPNTVRNPHWERKRGGRKTNPSWCRDTGAGMQRSGQSWQDTKKTAQSPMRRWTDVNDPSSPCSGRVLHGREEVKFWQGELGT